MMSYKDLKFDADSVFLITGGAGFIGWCNRLSPFYHKSGKIRLLSFRIWSYRAKLQYALSYHEAKILHIYNWPVDLVFNGRFINNTYGTVNTLTNILYAADREDGERIRDPEAREFFFRNKWKPPPSWSLDELRQCCELLHKKQSENNFPATGKSRDNEGKEICILCIKEDDEL